MGHTEGPWTIYDDGDSGDNSDIVMAWIDDDEGGRNDDIAAMMMDRPASERKANARLIASAPELLAALKDVAEQIAAYDHLHGENSCAIDDAPALAAIRDINPCYDPTSNIYPVTKATGRERGD
jgi:hypothetical protein